MPRPLGAGSVAIEARADIAEFGIVAPVGRRGVEELLRIVADANDPRVSEIARACAVALGEQLRRLKAQVLKFEPIRRPSDQDEISRPGSDWFRSSTQSDGRQKLGSISKQGDRYLRGLFTAGALAVIRYAKIHGAGHRPWLTALLARRSAKVAAVALATKIARMAWAMMAWGERYREPVALAA